MNVLCTSCYSSCFTGFGTPQVTHRFLGAQHGTLRDATGERFVINRCRSWHMRISLWCIRIHSLTCNAGLSLRTWPRSKNLDGFSYLPGQILILGSKVLHRTKKLAQFEMLAGYMFCHVSGRSLPAPKSPCLPRGLRPLDPLPSNVPSIRPSLWYVMYCGLSTRIMSIVHLLRPWHMYYGHSTCTSAIVHVLWP